MFRKKESSNSIALKALTQADYKRDASQGYVTEDNFKMGYIDNELWVFVNRKDGQLGSPDFRFIVELNSEDKNKLLKFLRPKKRR